jgi:hypothetical protein
MKVLTSTKVSSMTISLQKSPSGFYLVLGYYGAVVFTNKYAALAYYRWCTSRAEFGAELINLDSRLIRLQDRAAVRKMRAEMRALNCSI